MKKLTCSLILAGSLAFGITTTNAEASTHTVKTGESLWIISNSNNVSISDLMKWNDLTSDELFPDQVLQISGKKNESASDSKTASKSSVASVKVVEQAMKLTGIPYVFGGTTINGFDCSGFIQYAFKKSGKNVSRTTLSQFAQSKKVTSPKPGDLVFFENTYRKGISHVGIYIGNNKFVHAGGKKSQVTSLNNSYWKSKFHSFKRL
ncbi:NlpC/P60 family protein [Sporosarcina sp. YIM B06819]|uniref:C40 family peptidase n=1 Tax=Sporosarcina sp. YIM B06819 TaxID=3081769 RepID=UPI00298D5E43|nr:NlpC/P60 family protein [Sporosarcina sp. YIM B06819]